MVNATPTLYLRLPAIHIPLELYTLDHIHTDSSPARSDYCTPRNMYPHLSLQK